MIRDKSAVLAGMMLTICVGSASCASYPPYNPDRLDSAQVSAVANICRTVMGLDPAQLPVANLWPGDPDPASTTNDYRGCVASLSNVSQTQETRRAPQRHYADLAAMPEIATGDSDPLVPEIIRRERLACAKIGLDPTQTSFAGCVRGLQDVLVASEMDANYEN